MKNNFLYISLFLHYCCLNANSQNVQRLITLDSLINYLSLESPSAKIEILNYQNEILQFENYKKSLLPAVSFNLNPINFNRSLRLLQQPTDGSYSYVEDYTNNSSAGISVRQKIGITGGEIYLGSNINYLNEFSRKLKSFSTTPFAIGYSQQLWGGWKQYKLEKNIEYTKNKIAIKQYCTKLSQIQQKALDLFMTALLGKMERDLALRTTQNYDTLLQIARLKLENGHITEYDFKQIELQLLNTQYAYENATKTYSESLNRLGVFLGLSEFDIAIPNFNVLLSIDCNLVMSLVKQNNPFFKQQEIQILEAERNLFSSKLSNRFNGKVSLNYGINQYAETFINAYRNGNTQQSIVVSFQIPIIQWGINKNRIKIAKNNYETSKLDLEKRLSEFENEIKESINRYNHSVKLWLTAEKTYMLSQEQCRRLVQKYSFGKVSVYEVTTAQNDQNLAMQRYYSAIKETYYSYFTLRTMALYEFKNNLDLEEVFIHD